MTLDEIKTAVQAGKRVCWSNEGYEVVKDNLGQWFIKYMPNGHCIGLTHQDGVTMNGRPGQFFVVQPQVAADTGVPNLDDCDPDELEQHISALGALQRYGELRRFARDARLAGQMPRAQQLEARMQAIYSSLPAWAKW